MRTAAQILHEIAGSPAMDGCVEVGATCWICAEPAGRGMPVSKFTGASFTDQNKALRPDSDTVCEACVWSCSWTPPPGHPPPEPGKKGVNLRLFTHLYDAGEYQYANKAGKARIRQWLRSKKRGPWFAAIADSGQKHTLPWAPVNPGESGSVFFEDCVIRMPLDWDALDAMQQLLDEGVPKGEVESGEYGIKRWRVCSGMIREFESRFGWQRGSRAWALLAWLAQKGGRDVDAGAIGREERPAPLGHGARDSGDAGGVPTKRSQLAQALGTDPQSDAGGGADDDERGGMGELDAEGAPAADDKQLALFGGSEAKR